MNNIIKNNFLKEDEDITKLKSELEEICKKDYIDQIYNNTGGFVNELSNLKAV